MFAPLIALLLLAGPPEPERPAPAPPPSADASDEFVRPRVPVPPRHADVEFEVPRPAVPAPRELPPDVDFAGPDVRIPVPRELSPDADLGGPSLGRKSIPPVLGLPPHDHVLAYLRGPFKPESVEFYREHDIEWNRGSMDRRRLPPFFAGLQCLDGGWGTDSKRATEQLSLRVVTTRARHALEFAEKHPDQRLYVVINRIEDGIRPEWLRIVNGERVAAITIAAGDKQHAEKLRDYLRNFTTAPILLRVLGMQPDGTQSDEWAKSFGDAIADWDGFELYEMQRFATLYQFQRKELAETVGLPIDKPMVIGGIIGTDSRYEKSERRIARLWEINGPRLVRHLQEQGYSGFWTDGFSDMESAIKDRALGELLGERRKP